LAQAPCTSLELAKLPLTRVDTMPVPKSVVCLSCSFALVASLRQKVVHEDQALQALMEAGAEENRSTGPCTRAFNHVDKKWRPYGANGENLKPYDFLEEFEDRFDYEPKSDCRQSADAGTHAFLAAQLESALKAADPSTAVVDIGSGTGFLLSVFRNYVSPGVDVVGVELDSEAAAHSRTLLPESIEVYEQDALTFTYAKKFSVMNVGFASEMIPPHLLELAADRYTILMPVCKRDGDATIMSNEGKSCAAQFHIFEKSGGSPTVTAVGPDINFFYLPSSSAMEVDDSAVEVDGPQ